jgi:hypothetical protein
VFRLSFKSSSGPQGTDPSLSTFTVHSGIPKSYYRWYNDCISARACSYNKHKMDNFFFTVYVSDKHIGMTNVKFVRKQFGTSASEGSAKTNS